MSNGWNWDPFKELETMHRDLHRAFAELDTPRWTGPFSRISFLPGRAARAYPLVNFTEDEEAFHVEALAPGIDPKSIKISVTGNQLSLSGEKPGTGDVKVEAYHRNERAVGIFVRTMALPAGVDAEKIEARYAQGLLTLRLPKAEEAKPRQISVKVC